eukprot:CAMPEP_0117584480 /NCGR_PEP_ID=MMETSP0784-20121206/67626_1 /TAXON_ID=39447 /ORGANISM="" /LENGTH=91 /DNA_ID=CAMNT_0005385347 /DNA_START=65 /DNA_END=339 /DNA_ORIENTATION=+
MNIAMRSILPSRFVGDGAAAKLELKGISALVQSLVVILLFYAVAPMNVMELGFAVAGGVRIPPLAKAPAARSRGLMIGARGDTDGRKQRLM